LLFLSLLIAFFSKRIPERSLHGIVTFFAGLLVCCGFDTNG